jgi:hypothetical protein
MDSDGLIMLSWGCPNCGTLQEDSFAETLRPLCEKCGRDFYWEDLLTDEEWDAANSALVVLDSQTPS